MGGALVVTVPAFRLILGRGPPGGRPVLDRGFSLPGRKGLDGRLTSGAALATGLTPVLVFTAAMISGVVLHRLTVEDRPRSQRPSRGVLTS